MQTASIISLVFWCYCGVKSRLGEHKDCNTACDDGSDSQDGYSDQWMGTVFSMDTLGKRMIQALVGWSKRI
jgi:hypothetical protein